METATPKNKRRAYVLPKDGEFPHRPRQMTAYWRYLRAAPKGKLLVAIVYEGTGAARTFPLGTGDLSIAKQGAAAKVRRIFQERGRKAKWYVYDDKAMQVASGS